MATEWQRRRACLDSASEPQTPAVRGVADQRQARSGWRRSALRWSPPPSRPGTCSGLHALLQDGAQRSLVRAGGVRRQQCTEDRTCQVVGDHQPHGVAEQLRVPRVVALTVVWWRPRISRQDDPWAYWFSVTAQAVIWTSLWLWDEHSTFDKHDT